MFTPPKLPNPNGRLKPRIEKLSESHARISQIDAVNDRIGQRTGDRHCYPANIPPECQTESLRSD